MTENTKFRAYLNIKDSKKTKISTQWLAAIQVTNPRKNISANVYFLKMKRKHFFETKIRYTVHTFFQY